MAKETPVTPIYGERALSIGKTVVVADLHIGLEHELRAKGASIPSQAKTMLRDLISLLKKTGAEELIILGDVKHNIPSIPLIEYKDVPRIINPLSGIVEVTIVKGNHDGNLERILPDLRIVNYLEKNGVLFTHGHQWIKAKAINTEVVVLAHSHPAVAFVDEFSNVTKEPAWIRGRFNEKIRERYEVRELPEFIITPAYNQLLSGMAFNSLREKKLLGPYLNSGIIDLETVHAYLLDGTDLGPPWDLEASEEEAQ